MKNIENKNTDSQFNYKKRHFSLLTFVLLICIIELMVSAFQNINKSINFSSKIKNLEAKRNEEKNRNKQLTSEIENFDSEATLESIARNNLKMAGEDEILIIINNPQEKKADDIEVNNKKLFGRNN